MRAATDLAPERPTAPTRSSVEQAHRTTPTLRVPPARAMDLTDARSDWPGRETTRTARAAERTTAQVAAGAETAGRAEVEVRTSEAAARRSGDGADCR